MGRRIAALIRHGDYHQLPGAPSALQPFPLNEAGQGHARHAAVELVGYLERENWHLASVVDSSRLLRGWQTAAIMVDRLGDRFSGEASIESFDELAERSVGSAANLTVEQIERILRDDPRFDQPPAGWKADSRYRLPLQGAESLLEAGERVAGHLVRRMSDLNPQDDTVKLFVGHGAAFRHAAYHLGVLAFDDIAKLSMYHGRPVFLEVFPDGSWKHVAGEWKVRGKREDFVD